MATRRPGPASWLAWVPILIFVGFTGAFLIAPAITLVIEAVSGPKGPTLHYLAALDTYRYRTAFANSVKLSASSALVGLVAGGILASVLVRPGAPRALRAVVTSFAAVAANFAGVPLAFAFIASFGALGLVTIALKSAGIDLYAAGFSLYSLTGLTLTYAYFQVPLMLIVILPALEGLRREWREAAVVLGASRWQFWRHVGLPVLAPSLLAAFVLLFGNAFSAYATPYALTSGNIGLVTIEISNLLSGNVTLDPQVGAALAAGMIVVMTAVMGLYLLAGRRAARWRA